MRTVALGRKNYLFVGSQTGGKSTAIAYTLIKTAKLNGVDPQAWLADIRTTNPIESTFATIRHRTGKTKGCLSRKTGLAMAFKLMMSAQTKWRKLDGANRMPEIIEGIAFKDGIKQLQNDA
jgi:transposase-like protein